MTRQVRGETPAEPIQVNFLCFIHCKLISTVKESLLIPHVLLCLDDDGYRCSDIDSHVGQLAMNELMRVEWTTLKYYCFYHPCCGFDFELDWIVATGGLLSEMVSTNGHSFTFAIANFTDNRMPTTFQPRVELGFLSTSRPPVSAFHLLANRLWIKL